MCVCVCVCVYSQKHTSVKIAKIVNLYICVLTKTYICKNRKNCKFKI